MTKVARSLLSVAWLALLAASGCVAPAAPSPPSSHSPSSSASLAADASPTIAVASSMSAATATTGPTGTDPADGPPDASLAAEGGDAVIGQLGTYTWKETGSDAPWLPGARITVGAGEPLSVRVAGDGQVGAWVARAGPTGSDVPPRSLGAGSGPVEFDAPEAGIWSLAVELHFADGSGVATYYWELHVI